MLKGCRPLVLTKVITVKKKATPGSAVTPFSRPFAESQLLPELETCYQQTCFIRREVWEMG